MKKFTSERSSERGGAAVKFLLIFLVLALAANAGYNYVPVAYEGASFRQEMDTAVVKGLGSSGRIQPLEVVTASITRARRDYNLPEDTFVEVKPVNGIVEAHVVYSREINMLPFGLYKYQYNFDHHARPVGYLLKQ
jgi:hypothetical protein